MSEEKDYKYKLEKAGDVSVIKKIFSDANRQNALVYKNGRKGIFKPTLNLRAKTVDIADGRKTCAEYGEFIAHKILEQIGIPSCDVDILERYMVNPRSASGKGNYVPGVISYIDLADGEVLKSASDIIFDYKLKYRDEFDKIINPLGVDDKKDAFRFSPHNEQHNNNIEVVIPAILSAVRDFPNSTEEQVQEIKQQFIDMVMFDCRFANRDRHDDNYGLAITEGNKSIRFYPLFDNEYILGFSEQTADISKYSAARLQEHLNKDLYSVMGVTSQPTKLSASSMITYLFSTYPEEAQKAYEKVMKFTEHDLLDLMAECEGLPREHQAYAARIFRLRGRELEAIQQEYIDENGNPKEQILPGNKPMELVKGMGGSGSRKNQEVGQAVEANQTEPKARTELQTKEKGGPVIYGDE